MAVLRSQTSGTFWSHDYSLAAHKITCRLTHARWRQVLLGWQSADSGLPDKPENYHTVTIELSAGGNQTHVLLTQDNNATEQDRDHSDKNWGMMLAALNKFLEQ